MVWLVKRLPCKPEDRAHQTVCTRRPSALGTELIRKCAHADSQHWGVRGRQTPRALRLLSSACLANSRPLRDPISKKWVATKKGHLRLSWASTHMCMPIKTCTPMLINIQERTLVATAPAPTKRVIILELHFQS